MDALKSNQDNETSPLSKSVAPISTSGMPAMMTGRRGVPLAVPLPFLLTGACSAALFGLLLPWIAPEAIQAPGFPHVLALVHIATLGWLTMTIMGASLQLAPVIVVAPLRAARFIRWQYPMYGLNPEEKRRKEMVTLTQPLRDEHKELLPHIELLQTVADSIGEAPIGSLRRGIDEAYEFLTHHLLPHAQAEEQALYPVVGRLMGAPEATPR